MTLVDGPRIERIKYFVGERFHADGLLAEVGVYKGGTAKVIANAKMPEDHLFLFDTFEGMPEVNRQVDFHHKGDFSDTDLESVKEYVKSPNVSYYKGIFPQETSKIIEFMQFKFVHLDCDIYQSVIDSLNFFGPRMAKGGIIVIDDYLEPNCPGAFKATNEFCKFSGVQIFSICQSQAAIRF